MTLKLRLYLLKRMLRRIFTPVIRKALVYAFYSSAIAAVIVVLYFGTYLAGYNAGVTDMANRHETDLPMCVTKDTEVRENPTGYILSEINRGEVVWVVQLQVPFAVIWYSDGHSWYLGTTTASLLTPCEFLVRENL